MSFYLHCTVSLFSHLAHAFPLCFLQAINCCSRTDIVTGLWQIFNNTFQRLKNPASTDLPSASPEHWVFTGAGSSLFALALGSSHHLNNGANSVLVMQQLAHSALYLSLCPKINHCHLKFMTLFYAHCPSLFGFFIEIIIGLNISSESLGRHCDA